MTAVLPALFCLLAYYLGYRYYAQYLSKKIFSLDDSLKTPSHEFRDDVDYVPSQKGVLFGHHFASITGLSPMLGPAIAVIWGWLPGMLWVVFGAIFVGCVHDFSSLVVSIRAKGQSIGKVAEGILGKRAKTLFHLIIFFGISLAMGVFAFVIATLFQKSFYPQAVFPSGVIMVLAVMIGYLVFRKKIPLKPLTISGFIISLISVFVGLKIPILDFSRDSWIFILLLYALIASILPVWILLQPRDFLNSLLLYLGLGSMFLGFFVTQPHFSSPMVVMNPEGAPPIFPFVFITIACGAASGFHSLVASGTTAKQLNKESDALPIGYGGMIGESLLGLISVLACTAGFQSVSDWQFHYQSWNHAQGLGNNMNAFVNGATSFLVTLGIPELLATSFIAVVVVSFALTTLDSGTRLLRYNISEMGQTMKFSFLDNRYISSLLAVLVIGFFAYFKIDGKPSGLKIWALFGTTNQLLAGLALLTVTLYLWERGRKALYTGIPTVFMLASSLIAMSINLWRYFHDEAWLLTIVGGILLFLALWLTFEALLCWRKRKGKKPIRKLQVF